MAIDNTFALIFRFGMIFVYIYLFLYFYEGYKHSKKTGFKNNYFLGFSILFFILIGFHFIYGSIEFYMNEALNPIDIRGRFFYFDDEINQIGSLAHQIRPLYLFFYFLMNCILAAQVYPLEKAMGWEKNPWSKIMVIFGASELLLFIPALSYSLFAYIPIVLGFVGIFLGFVLNFGVNIKLYLQTSGELKKKTLNAIFAFLFLGIGLYWSMEVGVGGILHPAISNRWDVVIGSCLQLISAFFYRYGFRIEDSDFDPLTILKGNFNKKTLLSYSAIMLIAGLGTMFIARILYAPENAYSIMKDTISFLGSSDLDNNPDGWMFLSISFVTLGLGAIPLNLYRFHYMKKISKGGAFLSLLFYTIASLGLILIAFFPDNGGVSFFGDLSAGRIHNTVALFAFGGFGAGFLFDFFLFVKDQIPKIWGEKIYPLKFWLIPYIIFFAIVGTGGSLLIIWDVICESGCWPGDGIYSFPLWEWIVLFVVYSMYFYFLFGIHKVNERENVENRDNV